jgi:hypothetical protein
MVAINERDWGGLDERAFLKNNLLQYRFAEVLEKLLLKSCFEYLYLKIPGNHIQKSEIFLKNIQFLIVKAILAVFKLV